VRDDPQEAAQDDVSKPERVHGGDDPFQPLSVGGVVGDVHSESVHQDIDVKQEHRGGP
jgi:hypothetical protein